MIITPIYPDLSLTEHQSNNVVPREDVEFLYFTGPLPCSSNTPLPISVNHKCDGRYLLMRGIDKISSAFLSTAIFFEIFGVLMFLVTLFMIVDEALSKNLIIGFISSSAIMITIGLIFHWGSRKKSSDKFFLFDRHTKNVLFPRQKKRNTLVVPFNLVNCYSFQHDIHSLRSECFPHLVPLVLPAGEVDRIDEIIFSIHAYAETIFSKKTCLEKNIAEWSMICQFMDSNKPIPEALHGQVRWHIDNQLNVVGKDRVFNYYPEEILSYGDSI